MDSAVNPWLHRFAVLTALATLILIVIGGLVTSHGAGMAVPDWPNTYGYNMFLFPFSKWVGGILYEHSHRLMASFVGVLTTALALWLWARETSGKFRRWGLGTILFIFVLMGARVMPVYVALACAAPFAIGYAFHKLRQSPRELRWLGIIAFSAVILQGVLGGLRVVWLKDEIGVFHATLAQLFFSFLCAIALVTSKWWQNIQIQNHASLKPRWLLPVTTLLLLLQLALGATMRHQHAGLAIPDFPLAYGKVWPAMDPISVSQYNQQRAELTALNPITGLQVGLQMVHRLMALLICIAIAFCTWSTRQLTGRKNPLKWLILFWLGLILTQALLGAATIWSNKAADIATAHVLIGAVVLALGIMLNMISFRSAAWSRQLARQNLHESATFSAHPSTAASY
jgi:cytochrome c oxidase assembly protein subunit 15